MNRICKRHPPPSGSTEAARLPEDCAELRSLYRSALIPAREGGLFAHNSQNLRAKAMPTPSAALSIILPLGPIVGKASQKKSCLSRIAKGRPVCGDPGSCLMGGMATSAVLEEGLPFLYCALSPSGTAWIASGDMFMRSARKLGYRDARLETAKGCHKVLNLTGRRGFAGFEVALNA